MKEIFFDKSVIQKKSNNIKFDINIPKFKKKVLQNDQSYEGAANGYYKIHHNNNQYQIWYRGVCKEVWKDIKKKICNSTKSLTPFEEICYGESNDGLHFAHKECLTHKDHNKIIKKENFCHNFFPYYDPKSKKYIALSGTGIFNKGLFLFESKDGIIWNKIKKIIDPKDILPGWKHYNHFDNHNCIVYNSHDNYYYIYIRDNQSKPVPRRFIQYTKTKDFITFSKMKNIMIHNDDKEGIYNFNVFIYPDSKYFIALPCISNQSDLTQKLSNKLLYSLDGENWHYFSTKFIHLSTSYFIANNIVYSNDNAEMFLYLQNHWSSKNNCLDCYSTGKDRISKIICEDDGFIQMKLINLINYNIMINYKVINDKGWIKIQLIDINKNIFMESLKYVGNEHNQKIKWNNNKIFNDDQYYIKFIMFNCNLYSFSYNI